MENKVALVKRAHQFPDLLWEVAMLGPQVCLVGETTCIRSIRGEKKGGPERLRELSRATQ